MVGGPATGRIHVLSFSFVRYTHYGIIPVLIDEYMVII